MTKGRALTLIQRQEIAILRELGLSAAAIASKLGVSVRSVQRFSARAGIAKGVLADDLIQDARERFRASFSSSESLQNVAQLLIADDLAHARLLRAKMAESIENMEPRNLEEVALLMRACAAYSTALKNTGDLAKRAVDFDRLREANLVEELPELSVLVLTEEDTARLREEQRQEALDMGLLAE